MFLPKTIISDGGWGLFIIVQYNMGTKLNSIPAQDEPSNELLRRSASCCPLADMTLQIDDNSIASIQDAKNF